MAYGRRGFIVNQAAADDEFKLLETELSEMRLALNVGARNEYAPNVERHVRMLR